MHTIHCRHCYMHRVGAGSNRNRVTIDKSLSKTSYFFRNA